MLLDKYINPVKFIKGIGSKNSFLLKKINIVLERDLLLYFPRDYDDRRSFSFINDSTLAQSITVRAEVVFHKWQYIKRRKRFLKIIINDGKNEASLICFNRSFLEKVLIIGSKIILHGKFIYKYGEWQSTDFTYEFDEEDRESLASGRIVPVYSLTDGISQKLLRESIWKLLQKCSYFDNILPDYILKKRGLITFNEAVRNLHYPSGYDILEKAKKYFSYLEFFLFELGLFYRRGQYNLISKKQNYKKIDILKNDKKFFGFSLTSDQKKSLEEIFDDMYSSTPMHRLLLGDVGSGKTAVATGAILLAVQSGYQTAIIAPTSVLARQLYSKISSYLISQGIDIAFFSGRLKKKERNMVLRKISSGETLLVVGTHAVFSDDVEFKQLNLVIIDEQHRFGVNHRKKLREKGSNVDYLAMSATPIPRSLAMSFYGDFNLSRIVELPKGRKPIKTFWLKNKQDKAFSILKKELALGRQGYIVYPLIEETEKSDLNAAETAYANLKKTELADFGIGLLHGRLDDEVKNGIMQDFKDNKIGVLIATTVIEVGIDNPNATVMIIQDSQRFGLSQLHQLRGRVGRGQDDSYCFLLTSPACGDDCRKRMDIIVKHNDGFLISEEDLKIRGPGDFFGVSQSGLPKFYLADIVSDSWILERARKDALYIYNKDSELKSSHNYKLLSYFKNKNYSGNFE